MPGDEAATPIDGDVPHERKTGRRLVKSEGIPGPFNFEALNANIELEPTADNIDENETKKNNRLRKLVRIILTNTTWARSAAKKTHMEHGAFKTAHDGKLTFNLNAFRVSNRTCGELSSEAIGILLKIPRFRTAEDVKVIEKVVYRMKCFERYPIFVKQGLARIIYYDSFQDGRLIIKQGHPGSSFYFIVSGSVLVERTEIDPFTNERYTQPIAELHAGDSFGELALLHNTKRAASIICCGNSEFFRIDKPDFNEVLRGSHQSDWGIRVKLLNTHPMFQGWTKTELKIANGHASVRSYPPNTVIVSEDKLQNDRVFFIASGACAVVRKLNLVRHPVSKCKYRYKLPSRGLDRLQTSRDTLECRYFKLAELKENDYFNVGEDMKGIYVVSIERVVLMQIGLLAFSSQNSARMLEEMKATYISRLPTFSDAFEMHQTKKRWECYKRNVVVEILKQKGNKPHSVSPSDVPGLSNPDYLYYLDKTDLI